MKYAIGDIHGQFSLLQRLYEMILLDIEKCGDEENEIIFLGDYIDRGPEKQKVLDFLKNLQNSKKIQHIYLWGNHEEIFKDAMEHPTSSIYTGMWTENGGQAFMNEFGCKDFHSFNLIFPWYYYVNWFDSHLDYFHETEDYVFVHGGLDVREKNMDKQNKKWLKWARHTNKDHYADYHKLVIHGHTPNPMPIVDKNRINVDTNGWWDEFGGYGLTAVKLHNRLADGPPEFIQAL